MLDLKTSLGFGDGCARLAIQCIVPVFEEGLREFLCGMVRRSGGELFGGLVNCLAECREDLDSSLESVTGFAGNWAASIESVDGRASSLGVSEDIAAGGTRLSWLLLFLLLLLVGGSVGRVSVGRRIFLMLSCAWSALRIAGRVDWCLVQIGFRAI